MNEGLQGGTYAARLSQSLTPVMRSQSRAPLPVDKDEAGNFETPLNSQ